MRRTSSSNDDWVWVAGVVVILYIRPDILTDPCQHDPRRPGGRRLLSSNGREVLLRFALVANVRQDMIPELRERGAIVLLVWQPDMC